MRLLGLALFSMILTCISTVAVSAQQRNAVRLDLQLVGCAQAPSPEETVRLTIQDYSSPSKLPETRETFSQSQTVYRYSVSLAPGAYRVGIFRGSCGDFQSLMLLPGQDRVITLIGRQTGILTNSLSCLAGTLPIPGMRVGVRYALNGENADNAQLIDASVVDTRYYLDSLPPGHAILRIYGPRYRWVEFDVGDIGMPSRPKCMRFDISMEMLTKALKQIDGL